MSKKKSLDLGILDENIKKNLKDDIITNKNYDNKSNIEYNEIITIKDFKSKEIMHYKMLDKFFSNCDKKEILTMISIIDGNHIISLRFLDWFVTRYCFLYKLSIDINNTYCKENNFNINISYKAQLKSFKKKYFDPFRRKKKFYYTYEKSDLMIITTIGQLNFFRWALNYDIINYTENNYKIILDKLNHVNSYFKKNIIENNSFSTSNNSDENTDEKNTDEKNEEEKNEENNEKNNEKKNEEKNNESIKKKIIIDKDYKKNSQYKNPIVSRNICIEF